MPQRPSGLICGSPLRCAWIRITGGEMNFFKLYIGDYQRDTAHLSVAEHGAYLLMLQHYYATERPLPTGKALLRMLRAHEPWEIEAIESVTAQFWTVTEAGLVNERADAEIDKAAAQAETNRRIANQRIKRRTVNETSNDSCNEPCDESLNEPCNESYTNRSTVGSPIQTPDTRHQTNNPPSPLAGGSLFDEKPSESTEQDEKAEKPIFTAGFEEFWQTYPRKAGKLAASKAYSRAVKLLGGKGRVTLEAAVKRYAALAKNLDPQFIPHPATWLNQGRWDDSPPPAAASGPSGRDAFGVGG